MAKPCRLIESLESKFQVSNLLLLLAAALVASLRTAIALLTVSISHITIAPDEQRRYHKEPSHRG